MSMKVNLVVASGVHEGKTIPVPGDKLLIGRDPHCQLRPASQLVSKQHCAIFIQNNKVYLKDYGSTNGTFLNNSQVEPNSTIELKVDDRIRVGPLDFTVQFTPNRISDTTPVPEQLKAVPSSAVTNLQKAAGVSDSNPAIKKGNSGSNPAISSPAAKPEKVAVKSATQSDDDIAALLLGDDDGPATVPGGSTIMEMPAVVAEAAAAADKDKKKSAIPTREDSSNAANELLKKMMRRPR
jgi:pSer/pThr/pTyr-binding forkhead associated (FHA) protein